MKSIYTRFQILLVASFFLPGNPFFAQKKSNLKSRIQNEKTLHSNRQFSEVHMSQRPVKKGLFTLNQTFSSFCVLTLAASLLWIACSKNTTLANEAPIKKTFTWTFCEFFTNDPAKLGSLMDFLFFQENRLIKANSLFETLTKWSPVPFSCLIAVYFGATAILFLFYHLVYKGLSAPVAKKQNMQSLHLEINLPNTSIQNKELSHAGDESLQRNKKRRTRPKSQKQEKKASQSSSQKKKKDAKQEEDDQESLLISRFIAT
ncbi:MAG: hypothetical protein AAF380_02650 [Bacteroidota bacterium]